MTKYNRAILSAAGQYLGLKEIPGLNHNPEILRMFEVSGHSWVEDDETPWCAAFANMVLAQVGLPTTGKLNARSFDTYGAEVALENAVPGDLVRLWRNSPSAAEGHIGFLVQLEPDRVLLRGGNQRDRSGQSNGMVSDDWYPRRRVQKVRRADGAVAAPSRPVLREGDRGAFVLDLQYQLAKLGYFAGRQDAIFGPLTRDAVMAFQGDEKLATDGVVGSKTWAALASRGEPRPKRDVTVEDLRERGSRTIQDADRIARAATGGSLIAMAGAGFETVSGAAQTLAQAEGALGTLQRLLLLYWPVLILLAVAGVAWYYATRIRKVRVEDAQTGANLRL